MLRCRCYHSNRITLNLFKEFLVCLSFGCTPLIVHFLLGCRPLTLELHHHPVHLTNGTKLLIHFLQAMSGEEYELRRCEEMILELYYPGAGRLVYERSEVAIDKPTVTRYYLVDSYDNEWVMEFDRETDKSRFIQVIPYRQKLGQSSDMMPFGRDYK